MPDAAYLRLKSQQCRELARVAILPEVRQQLRLFAEEFEAHADALDRMAAPTDTEGHEKC